MRIDGVMVHLIRIYKGVGGIYMTCGLHKNFDRMYSGIMFEVALEIY